MYKHHSLEEKKEIIRLHEAGACMVELMNRFHVRDHYLYILFGRYEKYGIDGLERYKRKRITAKLKKSVIEEYEKDILPLWQICVKYDISYTSVCRSDKPASEFIHKPLRAIYHWKTTFSPTSGEVDFIKQHHVGRVYIHYFDVVLRDGVVQPEATVRFRQNYQ